MADEKEEKREGDKETDEEKSPKKRSKFKLIGIGAVSLALVGGGGYFGYKKFVAKDQSVTEAKDAKGAKGKKSVELGALYKMDTFIVNLSGDSGARYLKATMQLELDDSGLVEELSGRTPQIRDLVLTLLSSKTFADISSASGKFALREELVSRINEVLLSGEVQQVFFTEFVVQ